MGNGNEIVDDVIDLEAYAKADKKPPHAKAYKIRIDKDFKEVAVPTMTGREILGLVGKTPETHMLSQKLRGGQVVPVKADEVVDFRTKGIERFQTLALDPTEGREMRRKFDLPEEDVECLDARGVKWEAIIEGDTKWLIIPDYPIPEGYNQRAALAALRIAPSYPDYQIDMVYFYPALALTSGRGIANLSLLSIDGKQFQQWSRHRTAANPWRPGLDNLCTHLLQVDSWLQRELGR